MTNQEREKTYSSGEAAKELGMSVQSLKRHRLLGHIQGTRVGNTNVYTYTESQLKAAKLTPRKPGPKRRSETPDDEQGSRDTTVMFKRSREADRLIGAAS